MTAILEKLKALGIDVGTYEELQAANPRSRHFGRMQIAREMQRRGRHAGPPRLICSSGSPICAMFLYIITNTAPFVVDKW